ncbi:MAG TPA: PASTA domain-containing protein, partial [Clostridia bacterium]|nr:PASTA domain-containing protein [Clostridia bacterium]
PFARQILLETLQYLGVRAQVDATPQVQVEVPDLAGLTVQEATKRLKELGLTTVTDGSETTVLSQMPVAGATLWSGSQVMLYVREGGVPDAQTLVQVPDVSGLSILEANRQLRARKLVLEISGNGLAAKQVPAAGEFAQPGDTVKVTFVAP